MKHITPYKLFESRNNSMVLYHGTRSTIPFMSFDSTMIGSGLVSMNNKYDGFFFTSEKDNAEYYTEYFLCKVEVRDIKKSPISGSPKEVLKHGLEDKQNYVIEDILDGAFLSDIVVVPKNNLDTVSILEWEFIGDEDFLFEQYDDFFGIGSDDEEDEDNYDDDGNFMGQITTKDMIEDGLDIMGIDIDYLLNIPVFKKYYDSKE